MVSLERRKDGVEYLIMDTMDLIKYNHMIDPVCDECLRNLHFMKDIILIPYINMAFCNKCGKEKIKNIKRYIEDDEIRFKREKFFKDFYRLEDTYE